MLLNLILTKQQNNATERVINQMTNTNSQGGIWHCDSCQKSTTKPSIDHYCECGMSMRYLKFDYKNEQFKY